MLFFLRNMVYDTRIIYNIPVLKNKRLDNSQVMVCGLIDKTGYVVFMVVCELFRCSHVKRELLLFQTEQQGPVKQPALAHLKVSGPFSSPERLFLLWRGLAAGCTQTLLCSGGSAGGLRRPTRGSANGMLFSQPRSSHTIRISWKRK